MKRKVFISGRITVYMPNVGLGTNNREENEDFSREVKYSIALGSISLGAIFVIVNYFSTRYLSEFIKLGLFLSLIAILVPSIAFFLTILTEGMRLATEKFKGADIIDEDVEDEAYNKASSNAGTLI